LNNRSDRCFPVSVRAGIRAFAAAGFLLLCAGAASAGWTVTYLNPPGAPYSSATVAVGLQQGGGAMIGGLLHASLWSGSAGSRIDLHPVGPDESIVTAFGPSVFNFQAGFTIVGGLTRAAVWRGSAATWVDLHPSWATRSEIKGAGTDGYYLAGIVVTAGQTHACCWSAPYPGFGADINPSGAVQSVANATSGRDWCVGSATFSGNPRAVVWYMRDAIDHPGGSWIDMNPAGAITSVANGIDSISPRFQTVGSATFSGSPRAGFWTALSAASWTDLHPSAATTSVALGTWKGEQVGSATFSGTSRACMWRGSAETWEDLSLLLTGSWSSTVASNIWGDATTTYISGYGVNNATGLVEALLWTYTHCPSDFDGDHSATVADIFAYLSAWFAGDPRTDFNGDGVVDVADIFAFLASWFAGC
jgi:hypothetical protein